MLYALDGQDLKRLWSQRNTPEFTGAEMLFATYRTDPAVVARILPKPLVPTAEPIALAFVARYPETNFGCVYNEGALFVRAALGREAGMYCLAMPVDDDMAMIYGRERLGFPKKMAERITLERSGARITGRVVRKGAEILRIEAELDSPVDAGDFDLVHSASEDESGRPCRQGLSFLFKFFPRPDGAGFDYLPRLVRQPVLFRPRPGLQKGEGRVVVTSSVCDPLGDVPVVGTRVACVYGIWDNTMLPGRVVRRVWNVKRFLPHAFFKIDLVPALLGWTAGHNEKSKTTAGSE